MANLTAVLAAAGGGYSSADIQSAVAGAQSTLFESLSPKARAAAVLAVTKAMQRAFVLDCVGGVFTAAGWA